MADHEVDPILRELCERASKEQDHDKLVHLIRQINDLLENRRQKPNHEQQTKASHAVLENGVPHVSPFLRDMGVTKSMPAWGLAQAGVLRSQLGDGCAQAREMSPIGIAGFIKNDFSFVVHKNS